MNDDNMKIYTKTGDAGQTSLLKGIRVDKDDSRIEANGELDELNAVIGIVKSLMKEDVLRQNFLSKIQKGLMFIMSYVASPAGSCKLDAQLVTLTKEMENEINILTNKKKFNFILPGASVPEAVLHLARAKTRTAERRLWTVNRSYTMAPEVMCFMNRLSDYFFALVIG